MKSRMSNKLFHVSQKIFLFSAIYLQSKHRQLEIALCEKYYLFFLHEYQTRVEKRDTQSDIKISFLKTLGHPTEERGQKISLPHYSSFDHVISFSYVLYQL